MAPLIRPANSNNLNDNYLENKQKKKTIGRLGECRRSRFSYCSIAPSYGDAYNPNEAGGGSGSGGGGGDDLPVSGPILWLNARTLADTLNDNDDVALWPDDSGNNNDAFQSVSAQRPVFKTNIQNGLPAVLFTPGNSEYLEIVDFSDLLTEGEVFIVFKRSFDLPTSGPFSGFWKNDDQLDACHVPFTDGNIYDAWGCNTRRNTGNPAKDLSITTLYNVVSAAGEWTSRIDTVVHFTTGTNTVAFSGAPNIYYGASFSGFTGFSYYQGYIMEVIMWDRKLTNPERALMNTYFDDKWNLSY